MAISHWNDASARERFERTYRDVADAIWPVAWASRFVDGPYGRVHVLESGPADAPPMVLVHAAGTTALLWHRQAGHLAAHRRLFAVDIPGDIGLSAQARPIRDRADVEGWMVALLDGLDIERADVVGASFGGFLGACFAIARPERVRTLVLLAPAATLQPFAPLARVGIRLGGLIPMPFTVRPALRSMTGDAMPDDRFVALMESGVRGFRYDPWGIFPSELSDEDLSAITAPTLVLLGGDEVIYDPGRAVERARRLLPDVRTEVLPGLGHLLGLQRPEAIDARIDAFVMEPRRR